MTLTAGLYRLPSPYNYSKGEPCRITKTSYLREVFSSKRLSSAHAWWFPRLGSWRLIATHSSIFYIIFSTQFSPAYLRVQAFFKFLTLCQFLQLDISRHPFSRALSLSAHSNTQVFFKIHGITLPTLLSRKNKLLLYTFSTGFTKYNCVTAYPVRLMNVWTGIVRQIGCCTIFVKFCFSF